MAIRALTIDFSGTVVRENHDAMMEVCRMIADSSARLLRPADAAKTLWEFSHAYYGRDYGDQPFIGLHQIEEEALRQTLRALDSRADLRELMACMDVPGKPEIFPDARAFFVQLPLPVLIVANADRAELEADLAALQLGHIPLVCSEDVGAYKPRREIFEAALQILGLPARDVLHVGDSLIYDVEPAHAVGMKTAWLNRSGKAFPGGTRPDALFPNLLELKKIMRR